MSNKRRQTKKRYKPNYMPLLIMLCLAVGCGYVTAKYVVTPVVNYVPQLAAEKTKEDDSGDKEKKSSKDKQTESSDDNKVVEDEVSVKQSEEVTGYALQFGCYSGKEAAEKAMSSLNIDGLKVIEQNDMYKIVGETYGTKDEAKTALAGLADGTNAFVTPVYKQ